MKKELQPSKVTRIVCKYCGELMVKIYPNSMLNVTGLNVPPCKKCVAKGIR